MSAEVSRRGSATKWLLVCFLFLLQLVSAAPNIVETDGALREHLVRNGAELGFVMGTPADGGMRGAFASKDYSVGDIVARIPRNMTVELGFGDIKKSSKRLASAFKTKMFDTYHGPCWASLPKQKDIFAMETFSDAHIKELQCPELDHFIQRERALFRAKKPTIAYSHLIIRTRAFAITLPQQSRNTEAKIETLLVPAIDVLNTDVRRTNTKWTSDDFYITLEAAADVKKGDELFRDYGNVHRNDVALLRYGFVHENHDPPLLCAVDRAAWDQQYPFENTAPKDPHPSTLPTKSVMREEVRRLTARLESFPTTEEEDEATLRNLTSSRKPGGDGWKMETIVRFRILRKRALRLTIAAIRRELGESSEL